MADQAIDRLDRAEDVTQIILMVCSFLEFWGLSRLIIKQNDADQESR